MEAEAEDYLLLEVEKKKYISSVCGTADIQIEDAFSLCYHFFGTKLNLFTRETSSINS